jgi:hypothetical protein
MTKDEWILDLTQRTEANIRQANQLKKYSENLLNRKRDSEAWSALECVEHLNRYCVFYHPEFKKRLSAAQHSDNQKFKSTWLGNYFAKSVMPLNQENGPKGFKMKTFKSMNPKGSNLTTEVLDQFIAYQLEFLQYIQASKNVDWTKVKTAISITKLIKLRLGDTFRVCVYHNQRHLQQAFKAINQIFKDETF